ncbi:hypothetical protein Tco_0317035 [Tanacetum coccineum]
MELMEKRRKHFAALRAQEKRNRPPTKAQNRTQMSTYLKHMGRYTYKQLKGKNFDEIQKLFDKEMKRVNTFVAMGSEVQESKEKKVEGSEETAKGSKKKMLRRKRAGKEQQQESSKKQRMEEDKDSDEVEEVSKDDEGELMKHLVIKKDEDITIKAIPLDTKLPVIIDYKLHKEGYLETLQAKELKIYSLESTKDFQVNWQVKRRITQFPNWFQKPAKPPNIPSMIEQDYCMHLARPIQPWISNLARKEYPRESFNELMDTPLDFSVFVLNRLKVDTLTPELLASLTFELMKGLCKSLVQLIYFLEEVCKATTNQLD